jgi:hypothetical protein
MRFRELNYNDTTVTDERKILNILEKEGFYWLIDSEIEDASISILNKTIIWNSGNYYSGNWYYGIWKNGNFYGVWENGIFENGNFKGKFLSGITSVEI